MAWLGGSHVAVVTKLAEGFSPWGQWPGTTGYTPSCLPTHSRGWQGHTCPPKVTCFVSIFFLGSDQPLWDNTPALQAPRSPLCHLGYFELCAVWLCCLCLPSPRASGYCVSVRSSHIFLMPLLAEGIC